jgi:hypothetical protein
MCVVTPSPLPAPARRRRKGQVPSAVVSLGVVTSGVLVSGVSASAGLLRVTIAALAAIAVTAPAVNERLVALVAALMCVTGMALVLGRHDGLSWDDGLLDLALLLAIAAAASIGYACGVRWRRTQTTRRRTRRRETLAGPRVIWVRLAGGESEGGRNRPPRSS